MASTIKVSMADLKVAKAPDSLTTLGLGSCIGLALYDPASKIGGLVHYMLPDSTKLRNNTNIAKFGDTGIRELYNQMIKMARIPDEWLQRLPVELRCLRCQAILQSEMLAIAIPIWPGTCLQSWKNSSEGTGYRS